MALTKNKRNTNRFFGLVLLNMKITIYLSLCVLIWPLAYVVIGNEFAFIVLDNLDEFFQKANRQGVITDTELKEILDRLWG